MFCTRTVTRTLALACLTLVASTSMTNVSQAQSISTQTVSSRADSADEYNAYINTYFARASLTSLERRIQNDIDNADTRAERKDLELERFLTLAARSDVNRAFQHAITALKADGDNLRDWNDCVLDLIEAIDACEHLLGYQEFLGSYHTHRNQTLTTLTYLNNAIESASRIVIAGTGGSGGNVISRPAGRR